MDYMDHWAQQEPQPLTDKEYEVSIRLTAGTGSLTVMVNATCWSEAHEKALNYVRSNLRVYDCFSRG